MINVSEIVVRIHVIPCNSENNPQNLDDDRQNYAAPREIWQQLCMASLGEELKTGASVDTDGENFHCSRWHGKCRVPSFLWVRWTSRPRPRRRCACARGARGRGTSKESRQAERTLDTFFLSDKFKCRTLANCLPKFPKHALSLKLYPQPDKCKI